MRRARCIAMVAAGAVGIAAAPAAWAAATTVLCSPNAHLTVHSSSGAQYLVRNPYGRGYSVGQTCVTNYRLHPSFTVSRTARGTDGGPVIAYPDILRGCIWQVCTAGTQYPVRVRDIAALHSSWHTRQGVSGVWNASYDLWFGKHRTGPNGRATRDGAELMIWIGQHGFSARASGSAERIDGYRWRLYRWRECDPVIGTCWNYLSYRIAHARWRVDHLDLRAFVRDARHKRLVRARWWLQSVGAGFEIWRGGAGLGTRGFSVAMRRG